MILIFILIFSFLNFLIKCKDWSSLPSSTKINSILDLTFIENFLILTNSLGNLFSSLNNGKIVWQIPAGTYKLNESEILEAA